MRVRSRPVRVLNASASVDSSAGPAGLARSSRSPAAIAAAVEVSASMGRVIGRAAAVAAMTPRAIASNPTSVATSVDRVTSASAFASDH